MRGFARVGGVVIGREPEGAELHLDLSMKDLSWETQGNAIRLHLIDSSNHEIDLGAFEASLVSLALAYAADGRVITVTMTTADPLTELRILLHPVLLDTTLGCHTIELDRFVDISVPTEDPQTKKLTFRGFQSKLIYSQQALYAVARAALIQALLGPSSRKVRASFGEHFDAFAGLLTSSMKEEENLTQQHQLFSKGARRPLW